MTRRRWFAVALAAAALLLLGRAAAAFYADYLWYAALDALPIWRVRVGATLAMRALAAAAWSLFLFLNLFAVRRSVVSIRIPRRLGNLEIGEEVPPRLLDLAAIVLSIGTGVLLAFAHDDWTGMLLARYGIPFGEIEPYFELDLGFFTYWLPFETSLRDTALVAILLAGALVIFLYALTPSLSRERGTLYVSQYVRRHLFALLAALVLVLAWSYRLDAYHVLVDGSSPSGAFTYADHHGYVPVSIALSIIAVAAAGVVLWAGWTGQLRIAFIAVAALLLLALTLRQVAPWLVRRSAPRAGAARELPYAATRAAYTRRAYGADRVRAATITGFPTPNALARGVSLWDPEALLRALGRGTTERIVALGWRAEADSSLSAIVPVAPGTAMREGRPWRVARVPAYTADERGEPASQPSLGDASYEDIIVPPALVADSAAAPLLVADSSDAIAAPALASVMSRLAFAWSLQDYRLLGDDVPGPHARIVTHRSVRDRVRRLAPFFTQGTSLTPLVDGDTLYWAIELYATSHSYPLSQPFAIAGGETRYARHAATAIVNAQSGRVMLAADPSPGPIASTWMRLVPGAFVPWSALPPRLAAALPPATDGAAVQAAAFASAGTRQTGPRNGHLPRATGADPSLDSAVPALFALPGPVPALAWSTPVLDEGDRLLGLVLAIGGRDRVTLWLPVTGESRRWPTVLDSLRRTTEATGADNGREPRPVHGATRAVPVAGGTAFVQTAYLPRPDGTPTVGRTAVLLPDGSIRDGATLPEALGVAAGATPQPPLTPPALLARVRALYEAMRRALARGDWTAFGAAYDTLGTLLHARAP